MRRAATAACGEVLYRPLAIPHLTAAVAANTCASMRLYITTMTIHTKALPDTYSKMESWRELQACHCLQVEVSPLQKTLHFVLSTTLPSLALNNSSGSLRRTSHPLLLNSGPYERSLTET